MLQLLLFLIIAYLLGSISSSILVCKLLGLPDPRTGGSKNPGATNVLRLGGKKIAIIVLLADILKGLVPVLLAKVFGFLGMQLVAVAVAAVLGHIHPLFFGFKGGKGVATSLGALLGISWLLGGAVILIWLTTAVIFRYSSLAAIVGLFAAPILSLWILTPDYILPLAVLSFLVISKHQDNMLRLIKGKESKLFS